MRELVKLSFMDHRVKLILTGVFCLLFVNLSKAQVKARLTIEECYTLAKENYPLHQRYDLIAKTADYNIDNIGKGYLPQLHINAQATYQSEVTRIPLELPGMNIPVLSKDQYKAYAEVNQLIYDGGVLKQQKKLEEETGNVETLKLEAELYKLDQRINQLFFGVLLIDEQLKQNRLLASDIQSGIDKVRAAVDNGTALKSDLYVLKADLLKTGQQSTELHTMKEAYINMLELFINKEIVDSTVFVKPPPLDISDEINRPELKVYDQQFRNLDIHNKILTAKALPKLSFFVQGGAGRPALNMLSNDFEMYYIGGIRLSWTPSVFYTMKKERSLIEVNRNNLEVQRNTFLFNTNLDIKQQNAEILKYRTLLDSDDEIIKMREEIKNTSLNQLKNGVINSSDYLRDVNAGSRARNDKILHEIRLLMAQYDHRVTKGD